MLQSFIGPIASLAGTWLQGRVDKAKAETDERLQEQKQKQKFTKLKQHLVCSWNKILQVKWLEVGKMSFGQLYLVAYY